MPIPKQDATGTYDQSGDGSDPQQIYQNYRLPYLANPTFQPSVLSDSDIERTYERVQATTRNVQASPFSQFIGMLSGAAKGALMGAVGGVEAVAQVPQAVAQNIWDQHLGKFVSDEFGSWLEDFKKIDRLYGDMAKQKGDGKPDWVIGQAPGQTPTLMSPSQQTKMQLQGVGQQMIGRGESQMMQAGMLGYGAAAMGPIGGALGRITLVPKVVPLVGGTSASQMGGVALGVTSLPEVLPSFYKAWTKEVEHPDTHNFAAALVNSGNAWLMTMPALSGMQDVMFMRRALKAQNVMLHQVNSDIDFTRKVLSLETHPELLAAVMPNPILSTADIRGKELIPQHMLLGEIPQGADALVSHLESIGADMHNPAVVNLLSAEHMNQTFMDKLLEAAGGDVMALSDPDKLRELAPKVVEGMKQHLEDTWQPARREFNRVYPHYISDVTPPFPMEMGKEEAGLYRDVQTHMGPTMGWIEQMGKFGNLSPDSGMSAGQIGELTNLAIAGPMGAMKNEIGLGLMQVARTAGVKTKAQWVTAWRAAQNAEAFDRASPGEKVLARTLTRVFGTTSNYHLSTGAISEAVPYYLPRYFERLAPETEGERLQMDQVERIRRGDRIDHRDWTFDLLPEGKVSVHEVIHDTGTWNKQQEALDKAYQGRSAWREVYDQHKPFITEQRQARQTANRLATLARNRAEKFSQEYVQVQKRITELEMRQEEIQHLGTTSEEFLAKQRALGNVGDVAQPSALFGDLKGRIAEKGAPGIHVEGLKAGGTGSTYVVSRNREGVADAILEMAHQYPAAGEDLLAGEKKVLNLVLASEKPGMGRRLVAEARKQGFNLEGVVGDLSLSEEGARLTGTMIEREAKAVGRELLALRGSGGRQGRIHSAERNYAAEVEKRDRWQTELDQGLQAIRDDPKYGDHVADLIRTDPYKLVNARPGSKRYLEGFDAAMYGISEFAKNMHIMAIRRSMTTLADTAHVAAAEKFGKGAQLAYELAQPNLVKSDKPAVLLEHMLPDKDDFRRAGYTQLIGGLGERHDANFVPAIFARNDIAVPWLKAFRTATSFHDISGLQKLFYAPVKMGKAVVFGTPLWHGENVFGSTIAQLLANPASGGAAYAKIIEARLRDPRKLAAIMGEAMTHGYVPTTRYEVMQHLQRLRSEADGHSGFMGAVKTISGPVRHGYNDMLEGTFWKAVDTTGLAQYMIDDLKLAATRPDIPADVRKYAAAYNANNLQGSINPLYVTRAWRHLRQYMSFAPNYWGNYLRSVEASIMTKIPFASRLGYTLASHGQGRFTPIRLRYLDFKTWRELARSQAAWADTYLMTALVAQDMLNVIGSGHHLWENEHGHEMDVDMSNFQKPKYSAGGVKQHAYVSGGLAFRRATDEIQAFGLGHDWGLGGALASQDFRKADGLRKAGMLVNGLMDGILREGAGKIGQTPEFATEAVVGTSLQDFLRNKQFVPVDRVGALSAFMPSGYQQRQALKDLGPNAKRSPLEDEKQAAEGLLRQWAGLPSIHYMGAESSTHLDAQQQQNYHEAKDAVFEDRQKQWGNVLNSEGDLHGWLQQTIMLDNQNIGIDAATFGKNTPAAELAQKHNDLIGQYHLNDSSLSPEQKMLAIDGFQHDWDNYLKKSSPEANAIWWDNKEKHMSDGDYLYWYTRQMKRALMAAVDHQGGEHIRAVEAKYANAYASYNATDIEAVKEQDPYYAVYHALLKEVGKTPMGAIMRAFTSDNVLKIMPVGLSPQEQQDWADRALTGSEVGMSREKIAEMAQFAKGIGGEQDVAQAGGEISGDLSTQLESDPEFQREMQQAQADVNG